ncbi:phage holin family protein [Nocardia sp. NPDC057668]|uniref:phage holin family protein n=1 Tax=Nocardia sp. NPDC057668 TaxID=3346202 RepID=UPI00366D3497
MTPTSDPRPDSATVTLENDRRSLSELVDTAGAQLTRLVRDEMALARIEMRDKGIGMAKGAGIAGAGGLLAFYGGGSLTAAAILALALVLPAWAAALIVSAVLFVLGAIAALAGKKTVEKAAPPVPATAIKDVRQDVEVLENRTHR